MWIDALRQAKVLADGAITVAYSYIGPEVTWPIYRDGSIGVAKLDVETTARKLNEELAASGGKAYVSINKALVTQASSAIPVVPLYGTVLFKVMKQLGLHEGCIEQIDRLFRTRLGKEVALDEAQRIRVDDWELSPEVQAEVARRWPLLTTETMGELADLAARHFRLDFGRQLPVIDPDALRLVERDFLAEARPEQTVDLLDAPHMQPELLHHLEQHRSIEWHHRNGGTCLSHKCFID
jgi:trans-2-enoyl-CoA reductase